MGTPREPKPAKYFVALLSSDSELLAAVETDLAAIFGFIDARSEIFPWSFSRFYEEEMGPRLLRRFVSFEPLASPERLADFKLATQRIEDRYRSESCPGIDEEREPSDISSIRYLCRGNAALLRWRFPWLFLHLSRLFMAADTNFLDSPPVGLSGSAGAAWLGPYRLAIDLRPCY